MAATPRTTLPPVDEFGRLFYCDGHQMITIITCTVSRSNVRFHLLSPLIATRNYYSFLQYLAEVHVAIRFGFTIILRHLTPECFLSAIAQFTAFFNTHPVSCHRIFNVSGLGDGQTAQPIPMALFRHHCSHGLADHSLGVPMR
jgi:hypothetical protein